MKNYFLLFFFLWIGWSSLFAQVTPISNSCGINFSYDNAGNRIKRFVCLDNIELQFRKTTEEEQVAKPLDLEGMIAESGFSQQMETEIEQLETLLSQPSALDLQEKEAKKTKALALTDQNYANLSEMVVFPNPTLTTFSIQGQGLHPESTVSIVSMDGRVLAQRTLGDGRDIDVSSLPEGAYLVTLVDKDQRRISMLVKSAQP
ncbi:MAG: T9SS type A sorting domain-containing protein [Bacteroidota bacterium]